MTYVLTKRVSIFRLDTYNFYLRRFADCGISFDDNHLEGILNLFRLLLSRKYRTYNEDGFEAFKENEPVIYCNTPSMLAIAQYLCNCVSNLLWNM